jgi:hypothetical protein
MKNQAFWKKWDWWWESSLSGKPETKYQSLWWKNIASKIEKSMNVKKKHQTHADQFCDTFHEFVPSESVVIHSVNSPEV